MAVIDLSTFEKPTKNVLLTIRRGEEWKVEERMPEDQALELAAECRRRGLIAQVDHG